VGVPFGCGGGYGGSADGVQRGRGGEAGQQSRPRFLVGGEWAAAPPVASDARMLVAGAHQPLDELVGYVGPYRVLTSDAVVLTMAEEPLASREKVGQSWSGCRDQPRYRDDPGGAAAAPDRRR